MFVANNYWNLYNFRAELINSFSDHHVILVAKEDGFENFFTKQECYQIDFNSHSWNLFQNVHVLFQLILIIKNLKPNYVFSFTLKPNFFVALLRYFFSFIQVSNITGFGIVDEQKGTRKLLLKRILRTIYLKSDFIFTQNNDDFARISKFLHKDRLKLVPGSGVNTRLIKFGKRTNSNLRVIFVGRLLKSKGLSAFVQAANILRANSSNYKFTIFGKCDFSHPDSISVQLIKEIKSTSKINLKLDVKNVSDQLFDFDVIVLLTKYGEGTPRSLLEAMASKVLVITADVKGCRDLYHPGNGVFLVEEKNLITQLKKLYSMDLEKFNKLQDENRKFIAKNYDVKTVISAYHSVICH